MKASQFGGGGSIANVITTTELESGSDQLQTLVLSISTASTTTETFVVSTLLASSSQFLVLTSFTSTSATATIIDATSSSTSTSVSTSKSPSPTVYTSPSRADFSGGAIAGVAVGAVTVIVLIAGLAYWLGRRARKAKQTIPRTEQCGAAAGAAGSEKRRKSKKRSRRMVPEIDGTGRHEMPVEPTELEGDEPVRTGKESALAGLRRPMAL